MSFCGLGAGKGKYLGKDIYSDGKACYYSDNNVLIGSGANLGGYSEIGAFSVIAPETKVPQHKVIPAYSLVEGNPCHIVRRLREDEIEALEKSAEAYKALADDYADINQNK